MRTIGLSMLALLLGACAGSQPVEPYRSGEDVSEISSEESRLWVQAKRVDEQLENAHAVYEDPQLRNYLQSIMNKLYPEFDGRIRVHILKSPILNAFALPNGSIYMHTGLIARLDNEAQLATVLAHEGAHFVRKHGLQQRRNVKDASLFATTVAIAGVPIVGDLLAASSVYGFSRDMEREADAIAYARLKKTGYATGEAAKTFEHLLAQLKALDIDEPYFFSSHPKLNERIESFNQLTEQQPSADGLVAEQRYLNKTEALRIEALKADLARNRYESVILVLNHRRMSKRYPEYAYYFLGEAYRLRGEDDDRDRALYAYQRALKAAPDFAPVHRALGVYYMKQDDSARAAEHFERFLELAPDSPRAEYVRSYLKQVREKEPAP